MGQGGGRRATGDPSPQGRPAEQPISDILLRKDDGRRTDDRLATHQSATNSFDQIGTDGNGKRRTDEESAELTISRIVAKETDKSHWEEVNGEAAISQPKGVGEEERRKRNREKEEAEEEEAEVARPYLDSAAKSANGQCHGTDNGRAKGPAND
ncbi:hypothetical protein niasHS_000675 [Heterodera schachtii]|uniref:Uncharacterized protein n=1 Tax=Heterodera schachtii TaxID=97005 RepID=A0ABD2K4W5_HETSC